MTSQNSDELIEIIQYDTIIEYYEYDQNNDSKYIICNLFKYIEKNQITEFRHYVNRYKEVLNQIIDGKYLIGEACRLGRIEFVTFMILLGCSMQKDNNGLYPQHYAVQSGKSILIDIMAMFGVRFNISDSIGTTLLQYAIGLGNREIINTLNKYGAC